MPAKLQWTTKKIKLGDLIEWDKNPVKISERDAKELKRSIDKFDHVLPYVAAAPLNGKKGVPLLDGHQRKMVELSLRKISPDTLVDVRVPSRKLTESERAEIAIRLRKNTGEFDFDKLMGFFQADDLMDWGFDQKELEVIGFEFEDTSKDAEPEIDRAAELLKKWKVKTGDMFTIGNHRLICGDCTDAATVARVMGGERAQLCFTSPPYNTGVSAQLSGNTSIDDNLYKDEYDDNQTQESYLDLLCKFTDCALYVSDYLFCNIQVLSGNKKAFIEYWHKHMNVFCDVAIWDKSHAAPAAAQRVMDSRFEFVLIFGGNGSRAIGTRDFRGMVHNIYTGSPQRHNENADLHAATFPVDLPEHFIRTFTNEGEIIYEPFCGTGTGIVACENLTRRCRAVEISPAYCSVALERMEQAFGITGKRIR